MSLEAEKKRYRVLLEDRNRVSNCRTRLRIAFYQSVQPHSYNWEQVKAVLDQVEACNFDPFLQLVQDIAKGTTP